MTSQPLYSKKKEDARMGFVSTLNGGQSPYTASKPPHMTETGVIVASLQPRERGHSLVRGLDTFPSNFLNA